jgi:copper homeostasis protein
MLKKFFLEMVCYDLESAVAAERLGADRIELCDNSHEGGTTPSAGIIKTARKHINIPIHVMIRPRGGDFVYSDREFESMKEDMVMCRVLGIEGFVFGILNPDHSVDFKRNMELIRQAAGLNCTFHRAFDKTNEPFWAMENIIDCGFKRILTSGQAETAVKGKDLIRSLVEKAGNRITIMPGGGIRKHNIKELVLSTAATEYHSSEYISY